jgi:hypothetical protein
MLETAIPESEHQERASRGLSVPLLLLTVCGVLLLAVAALIVWLVVSFRPEAPSPSKSSSSPETQGVPNAAVQKAFRLVVPDGANRLPISSCRATAARTAARTSTCASVRPVKGMKEFVASLGKSLGDLTAEGGSAGFTVDPDDIDSIGLPWKINTKGHLVGLYVDIPREGRNHRDRPGDHRRDRRSGTLGLRTRHRMGRQQAGADWPGFPDSGARVLEQMPRG